MTTVSRSIVIIVFDLFSLYCDFFLLFLQIKQSILRDLVMHAEINSCTTENYLQSQKCSEYNLENWLHLKRYAYITFLCTRKNIFFWKILMSSLFDNNYVNLILPFNSSITLFLTIKRTFSNWMFHEQLCF